MQKPLLHFHAVMPAEISVLCATVFGLPHAGMSRYLPAYSEVNHPQ